MKNNQTISKFLSQKLICSFALLIASGVTIISPLPAKAQVNSVYQLSDVEPTDWAFEALRSLIERYGCISGYPDGTYRGNRALSRYEFAAALNSCLGSINQMILNQDQPLPESDSAIIERLQRDFSQELSQLATRVDSLENRVAAIEETQFSTTTKLSGNVYMNLTGATASDDILVETNDLDTPLNLRRAGRDSNGDPLVQTETDDPEITFSYYTLLNFNTSFSGRDRLVTQFAVGNGTSPANSFVSAGLFNTFGTPFTDQTGAPNAGELTVREIFYSFPVNEKLQAVVGARVNWYRYFDGNSYTFFLRGASSYNASGGTLANPVDRGAGAVLLWDINDKLGFNIGYLGENTEFLPSAFFNTVSDADEGLFDGTWSATAQLTYDPSPKTTIRLFYTRSQSDNNVPLFDQNGNLTGFGVGGAVGEPIYGVADDGFGGTIDPTQANTIGLNFEWEFARNLGLFGRYTYANADIDPENQNRSGGDINMQAFQFGLAFPNLGKEGALGTFSFVVPFDVLDGEEFLVSGAGDGGTQLDFEGTYYYPVNDNFALVPAVYVVANPNNFEDNGTIFVGNLRMQFSF